MLLVHILEQSPWVRSNENSRERYVENKWERITDEDSLKLIKTEGQIWLTLYQLLLHPDCRSKYELNSHRKNILLKLKSFLTEVLHFPQY